jgi:glutamine amidotransferase
MYFMHSFVVRPADPAVICSTTAHGQDMFCSMLQCRNVYGTQFHPERSGEAGLRIYRNLMAMADDRVCREEAGCEV